MCVCYRNTDAVIKECEVLNSDLVSEWFWLSLPSDYSTKCILKCARYINRRISLLAVSLLPFYLLCLLSKIMCTNISVPSCSHVYSHIALFTLALHAILSTSLVEDSISERGMDSFVSEGGKGNKGLKKSYMLNPLSFTILRRMRCLLSK